MPVERLIQSLEVSLPDDVRRIILSDQRKRLGG